MFMILRIPTITSSLEDELPDYLAQASGTSQDIDVLKYSPQVVTSSKEGFLLQLSSAAAERVFSVLTIQYNKY